MLNPDGIYHHTAQHRDSTPLGWDCCVCQERFSWTPYTWLQGYSRVGAFPAICSASCATELGRRFTWPAPELRAQHEAILPSRRGRCVHGGPRGLCPECSDLS